MPYCTQCRQEISNLARNCPQCGHPNEPPPLVGPLAGFWIRFAAVLIDAVVLLVPSFVLGSVLPFLGNIIVGFLYDWLMVTYAEGRTVGKMALGIRVARPDGTAVDSNTAAARSAMKIVSGLPLWLGFIWAAFDPERRTWHDLVANTRVFVMTR